MKPTLNYLSKEVVNSYDEISLWSAPFALLMLQHIPILRTGTVVDLGFGTGFPLLELSQRYGEKVQFVGIDIWSEAINRTKQKIHILGITNVEIRIQKAEEMSFKNESIDMFCSNLGVNNFVSATLVFEKIWQHLKPSGDLIFTTNDSLTFSELFDLFKIVFDELSLDKIALENYLESRSNASSLKSELEAIGFKLEKHETSAVSLRFASAKSLFDHSLIRIAFQKEWRNITGLKHFDLFIKRVSESIEDVIEIEGEFCMTAPVLYFHFKKHK